MAKKTLKRKSKSTLKKQFKKDLMKFVDSLLDYVSSDDSQWTIKGFINIYKNIYTISADTKIISKILEIHLFPRLLEFADNHGYKIVLPDHQNYYPDITFIKKDNEDIKFALDIKTTYRLPNRPDICNRFTLGSHGKYFTDRNSTKNIQFPYNLYSGHFILGIIYSRLSNQNIEETEIHGINELKSIASVTGDFQFFVVEKWEIASDKQGSGNTANIGSIAKISDIIAGNGIFKNLGEEWFDDYWMNYNKITFKNENGKTRKIRRLEEFLKYRGKKSNSGKTSGKKDK